MTDQVDAGEDPAVSEPGREAGIPRSYSLTGGDGAACGPAFGPIRARAVAELVHEGRPRLVLEPHAPLEVEGAGIVCLVVSPRYEGETLAGLRTKECVVAVARVLPGREGTVGAGRIPPGALEYLAVGTCTPLPDAR